jgi:hypothetical protein
MCIVLVGVRVQSSVPIVRAIDVDGRVCVRVRELEQREGVHVPMPVLASGLVLCVGLRERRP